jgi:GAF domain-containing protein
METPLQGDLNRVNRALRMIKECNHALVRAEDERELLGEICRIILDVGRYLFTWVGYAEAEPLKRVVPVAQAGYEERYLQTLNISWADTDRGRGPTGTAIRTGRPTIAENILTDPLFEP